MFSILSRYAGLSFGEHVTPGGRAIAYVRRRFVPRPERFETLLEHVVTEGERLDTITAQHLGDPEQFWRVCDANGVIEPAELEATGRRVRITLPEGIPGPRSA
jgi:hypothetical protein